MTLLDGKTPLRPADIDRAARRLPPGAYRVIRALQQARLLVPEPGGTGLVLRPLWFGSSVAAEARRSLLDGSPLEWGEALLRPPRVALSLSGHSHAAAEAQVGHVRAVNLGSTYERKVALEIEV